MFDKILVPLDGSELAESILGYVGFIAAGCHASEVVLLRVRGFLDPVAMKTMTAKMVEQIEEASTKEAEAYLQGISEALSKMNIHTRFQVLSGNPADEIIEYSRKNGIKLIVMSTHGRTGVSRLVWGSVADKVLRSSTIPALIIPPGNSPG
ncbi:MAG: universal stress protein [Peptococcaceae bacterium]